MNESAVVSSTGGASLLMRTSRIVVLFGALLVASGARPCVAQQASAPPAKLIRLSVAPAAAPAPALQYLLLPELEELSPGNPIEAYYKCYLEQYRFAFDEARFETRRMLLAEPLDELPASDTRELGRLALLKVDRAARLDKPDWQVLRTLRADHLDPLLADVQAMRTLARALFARFRAEIAAGRLDDAMQSAKTLCAMSRHLGEHPSLIGALVGIAIANLAVTPLDDMIQRPECPNLYWALTNLPAPLIPIRTGIQGERLMCAALFRDLDSSSPMSADRIKTFIESVDKLLEERNPTRTRAYLAGCTQNELKLARERLAQSGMPEAQLEAFPPDQVILLDEVRKFRARFDELAKIAVLPAWQFEMYLEKAKTANTEPALFADRLLPIFTATCRVEGRLEQRIALLRHVEALRMYAAEHGGTFPAKLADVSVPLPDDPFTGKPFPYELSGKTARLRGTPAEAEKDFRGYRVHYEITLKD